MSVLLLGASGAAAVAVLALLLVREPVYEFLVVATLFTLSFNLTGPDAADLLVPVLLMVGWMYGHLRFGRSPYPPLLLFAVALFASFYAASNLLGAPEASVLLHVVDNAVLLIFLKQFITSPHRAKQALLGLIAGNVTAAALAVLMIAGRIPVPDIFFDPRRDPRYMGLIGDPNILGFLCMLLSIWLIDELLRPKVWRGRRLLKLLLFFFMLAQIALSLSRSAWLGMGVSLAAYAGLAVLRWNFGAALRLIVGGVLAVALAIPLLSATGHLQPLLERASIARMSAKDPAEAQRAQFYFTKRAFNEVARHHPFGVGTGRTERLLATDVGSLGAHNSYVQVMSDNGWITFVLFVVIVLSVGSASFRRALSSAESQTGIGHTMVCAALTGLAASAMFHDLMAWSVAWLAPSLAAVTLWPSARQEFSTFARSDAFARRLAD